MSDREQTSASSGNDNSGPTQRQKAEEKPYVYKPKRGGNKPGMDRRFKSRVQMADANLHKKLAGEEIPKTLRKREAVEDKMPVSPIYLGLFLFLVVGSAFFQVLQATQQE